MALAGGWLVDGEGRESRWKLCSSTPSAVRPEEADHARRLAADPEALPADLQG